MEAQALSTQGRGWVRHNRVKVLQDKRYDYDGFGRLIRKRIGGHTELHFRYDAQHRMTHASVIRAGQNGEPLRQVFRYHYDAIGRRIAKEDDFGATLFTWEGMRLLQECRGGQSSTYLYEPESYVPLARIDGAGAIEEHPAARYAFGPDARAGKQASVPDTNPDWSSRFNAVAANAGGSVSGISAPSSAPMEPTAQVYYFHVQPNGLPEEMSDTRGNLVWQARYLTWGATVQEHWQAFDATGRPADAPLAETCDRPQQSFAPMPQNLRMQGQYLDRETGLHYNTFRYYDPDLGAFTTPDPIGLAGGINLHQYAPNPIAWIDPWGWNRTTYCGKVQNKTTTHSTRKRAKEAAAHAHGGKKLPQPKKELPENATDAQRAALKAEQERYEQQQKYRNPDRHPNSDYPESHYHTGNKPDITKPAPINNPVNNHHTWGRAARQRN
ncbi:RHS repeat-associated core domain-containing protein [Paracidovorax avenae]|uniref:RHS repeat-associated core domain-containing protein n=1 Tax=Paracidovorax avenae TaxID=80867 RepID=UPI001CEF73B3|nr:RHS repeat-associated core domain-containing protein [Paracidovorax avenae]